MTSQTLKNNLIGFFKGKIAFGEKTERIIDALRELVNMLFAVVVGVGLDQIGKNYQLQDRTFPLLFLAVVYLAIILSWWGWNFGTICGPREGTVWLYVIDYVLLIVYWLLINNSKSLGSILILFSIMYFLYFLWEFLRFALEKLKEVKESVKINFLFFLLFVLLCVLNFNSNLEKLNIWNKFNVIFLPFLLIIYRFFIYIAYKPNREARDEVGEVDIKQYKVLVDKAKDIASKAQAKLSNYKVGAAILSDSNQIYVGCNIEFDNYSNTIHAEESAISAFVSGGSKRPVAIAIFTLGDKPAYPCGMCRQSLMELGGKELKVIAAYNDKYEIKTMEELLPEAFKLER